MPENHPAHRCSLVVTPQRYDANLWMWEIVRTPEPLGVKLYGNNFQSEYAARFAGQSALRGLLQGLQEEAQRD
jgi:hypothetical protein